MMRHWNYLKYLLRHKYYVFVAGRILGVPLWQLLVHDLSKFLPSEWMPYARAFYNADGSSRVWEDTRESSLAWLLHQKRNKHHWQYWLLVEDSGNILPLVIPTKYAREMVADWAGAGRAITGRWDVNDWYAVSKTRMTLHHVNYVEVAQYLALIKSAAQSGKLK